MKKYQVIWHDAGDDRTGSEFSVEASNPKDAYFAALKIIRGYGIERFHPIDIECLVDENGEFHHPDFFLPQDNDEN